MESLNENPNDIHLKQKNDEGMDPMTLSYTALAISNYWIAKKNRKLTKEIEENRVKEKRLNDSEAHNRAIEIQRININGKIHESEIKTNYDHTQIWNSRGNWLNTVAPNAKEPIVIFDTTIRNTNTDQEERFAFNPMESLCHSFKEQILKFSKDSVYVTNVSKEFKSQSAVEAFYNDELSNISAVIVYGSFDGNFLRVNAVYGGMSDSQFTFDQHLNPRILEKTPHFLSLAKIPVSFITKLTGNGEVKSEKQANQIKIQKNFIDLIANTALQTLIDSHFSLFRSDYTPLVGLPDLLAESQELGIEIKEMKESIALHCSKIIEQRDRIQSLRIEYQINYINQLFT